jgi:uncharacterized protein (UPF0333 family)
MVLVEGKRFALLLLLVVVFVVEVTCFRGSHEQNHYGSVRGLTENTRELAKDICGMAKNVPPTTTATATPPKTTATTTTSETTTTTSAPITTFCVVADAPYRYEENLELTNQVDNMDSECEFVAHLGDIRSARKFDTCVKETYTNASAIMKRSEKPVLMMLGGKP